MCRSKTPYPTGIRFCRMVDITETITYANFGNEESNFALSRIFCSPFLRRCRTRTTVRVCDAGNLRLLLVRCEFRHHASDSVLELAVLGGVDQRIDAAVDEHQCHGEVVELAMGKGYTTRVLKCTLIQGVGTRRVQSCTYATENSRTVKWMLMVRW